MRAFVTTVMLLAGAPAFAQVATVTIDPSQAGAVVTDQILGMNMANWFDPTQPGAAAPLKQAGIRAIRWPGGATADTFHWATNRTCDGSHVDPAATFDNLFATIVKPDRLQAAVSVNYGSNAACNAGGDPAEAAGWVAYAKSHGEHVREWIVGNEVYGDWEYDLHTLPHDAATYANAVANGYYPAIKAADNSALVGVIVQPGWTPAWDNIVLAQAKYDFVQYHYYAQSPGKESDAYLVGQAAQDFGAALAAVKAELNAAGRAGTPIEVGELGSVYARPGKQTMSITQALFAGQALGEMMNAGVARATWWLAYGSCSDASSGNFSGALYGWQNFGGFMSFSDGTPKYGCPNATPTPLGTMLPTSRAFELFSRVARTGQHALKPVVGGNAGDLRVYALTQKAGVALVLFNVNQTAALPVSIAVAGMSRASKVTVHTYDKAIYDQSQNSVWAGPARTRLGAQALPVTITLTPWSMNVVRILE